jgi:alpha-galactosidase/6-phospho-beta-glucosidase family protein
VDIDAERLNLAHNISEKLVEATGKDWAVESSTERNDVLAGTDSLVNSIEVAGLENVRHDSEQLAALNRAHMAVHELVVRSLLDNDRQSALYALMIAPLTAAVCSLEEIKHMFEEMWEAQRPFLTSFE